MGTYGPQFSRWEPAWRIWEYNDNVGMWLSLVEHVLREHGVGGSNPLIPTSNSKGLRVFRSPFFCVKIQRGTKWGTKKTPLGNIKMSSWYYELRRTLCVRVAEISVVDVAVEHGLVKLYGIVGIEAMRQAEKTIPPSVLVEWSKDTALVEALSNGVF